MNRAKLTRAVAGQPAGAPVLVTLVWPQVWNALACRSEAVYRVYLPSGEYLADLYSNCLELEGETLK